VLPETLHALQVSVQLSRANAYKTCMPKPGYHSTILITEDWALSTAAHLIICLLVETLAYVVQASRRCNGADGYLLAGAVHASGSTIDYPDLVSHPSDDVGLSSSTCNNPMLQPRLPPPTC